MTRQIEYHGELVSLTEAIVGFPVGGQVLISGSTYQRIYGRLHTVGPLTPISAPMGRSVLGRSRSRRLSSQPKQGWKGRAPARCPCALCPCALCPLPLCPLLFCFLPLCPLPLCFPPFCPFTLASSALVPSAPVPSALCPFTLPRTQAFPVSPTPLIEFSTACNRIGAGVASHQPLLAELVVPDPGDNAT